MRFGIFSAINHQHRVIHIQGLSQLAPIRVVPVGPLSNDQVRLLLTKQYEHAQVLHNFSSEFSETHLWLTTSGRSTTTLSACSG